MKTEGNRDQGRGNIREAALPKVDSALGRAEVLVSGGCAEAAA